MARNIVSGRSKAVLGIKELAAQLSSIRDASVGPDAVKVMGVAASIVRDQLRSSAKAAGVPTRLADIIFAHWRKQPQATRGKLSAIVGGVKRRRDPAKWPSVEWTSTGKSKSPRAKVLTKGGKISMGLITMFEQGTTRMKARPFFKGALKTSRPAARQAILNGFKAILAKHSGA